MSWLIGGQTAADPAMPPDGTVVRQSKGGMAGRISIRRATLLSGTVASLTSTLALMGLARAEGRGALQPTNATSHWLNGPAAAGVERADAIHTGVDYATHHTATLFWALPFSAWLASRKPRSAPAVFRDALIMSAVAAAVDYGATPKRFTPGWELVLSKSAMALTYAAMAGGLAAGALMAERR